MAEPFGPCSTPACLQPLGQKIERVRKTENRFTRGEQIYTRQPDVGDTISAKKNPSAAVDLLEYEH